MFDIQSTSMSNMIHPKTDKLFIEADDMIELLKDELLYLLSNPDEDALASDYLKDRITVLKDNFGRWEKSGKEKNKK